MVGRKRKKLTDQRFGFLTALYDTGLSDEFGYAIWHFQCICGNEFDRTIRNLYRENFANCGCLKRRPGRPHKDITNQSFGYLTALYDTGKIGNDNAAVWMYKCICGREIEESIKVVGSNKYISCGCKEKALDITKRRNIVGQTYGRLTVVDEYMEDGKHLCCCVCSCGEKTVTEKRDIIRGKTKSCGCLRRELAVEMMKRRNSPQPSTKVTT